MSGLIKKLGLTVGLSVLFAVQSLAQSSTITRIQDNFLKEQGKYVSYVKEITEKDNDVTVNYEDSVFSNPTKSRNSLVEINRRDIIDDKGDGQLKEGANNITHLETSQRIPKDGSPIEMADAVFSDYTYENRNTNEKVRIGEAGKVNYDKIVGDAEKTHQQYNLNGTFLSDIEKTTQDNMDAIMTMIAKVEAEKNLPENKKKIEVVDKEKTPGIAESLHVKYKDGSEEQIDLTENELIYSVKKNGKELVQVMRNYDKGRKSNYQLDYKFPDNTEKNRNSLMASINPLAGTNSKRIYELLEDKFFNEESYQKINLAIEKAKTKDYFYNGKQNN